jgi:hypothetical protein
MKQSSNKVWSLEQLKEGQFRLNYSFNLIGLVINEEMKKELAFLVKDYILEGEKESDNFYFLAEHVYDTDFIRFFYKIGLVDFLVHKQHFLELKEFLKEGA